jgi:phage terminase small subunit
MATKKENGLNPRQQRFVEEYLVDLNGKQAAIRAGYSPKTAEQQASRLLSNAKVKLEVAAATEKRSERTQIDADYVLKGILATVQRCEQAAPVLDRAGFPVLVETPSGSLAPAYEFDASNALRGYELLGKHLKLFTDKVEHSGGLSVTTSEMTPEDRRAEIQRLLAENPALAGSR